jgi:hypothetical protein
MASAEEARGERTRLQITHSNNRRYKTFESVSAFLYARPEDRRQSKNDNEFAVPYHSCVMINDSVNAWSHRNTHHHTQHTHTHTHRTCGS